MRIGYHASHEQTSPRDLLEYVREAERAGFQAAMCSDHLHPWSERQGESGYAWAWLGAALEATALSFGTVTAPGQRYHPVVLAQAIATLQQMYEGRLWVAMGSGEALNEHVTGEGWPAKDARNQRLEECVWVTRRLLAGETVSHEGHVTVETARLYTRPQTPVPIYAAALTPETAEWAGSWADGLITAAPTPDAAADTIEAFRRTGSRTGGDKPVVLQVTVSYAASDEEAARAAHHQWRQAVLDPGQLGNLPTTEAFDQATADVSVEDVAEAMLTSADPGEHLRLLRSFRELGPEAVYVHNVSQEERVFLDVYARDVLPELTRATAPQR